MSNGNKKLKNIHTQNTNEYNLKYGEVQRYELNLERVFFQQQIYGHCDGGDANDMYLKL